MNLRFTNNVTWRLTRDISAIGDYLLAGGRLLMSAVNFSGTRYSWSQDAVPGFGKIDVSVSGGVWTAVITAPLEDMRLISGQYIWDCKCTMPSGAVFPVFGGQLSVDVGVTVASGDASSTGVEGIGDTVLVEGEPIVPVGIPVSVTSALTAAKLYADTKFAGVAQADWNAVSGPAAILNKPNIAEQIAAAIAAIGLSAVATSGAYADLTGKPSLGALATATPGTGVAAAVANAINAAGGLVGLDSIGNLSLAPTWNNSGATYTGLKFNVTDTASASGSLLMDLQKGGVSQFKVDKTGKLGTTNAADFGGYVSGNNGLYVNSNLTSIGLWFGLSADLALYRDAANTLAQRNGLNTQTGRTYISYTDASNYQRIFQGYDGSAFYGFGLQGAGTGLSATSLEIGNALGAIWFRTGNLAAPTRRWQFDNSGNFLAATDNTYDIGASGANRPRNGYFGGLVTTGAGGFQAQSTGYGIFWQASTTFRNRADGVLTLSNYAENDFGRLQFGGTTSSFPAIKRNSAGIDIRLADNSDYAAVRGKLTTETAYTVGAITPTGYLTLYDANGTAYKVACST